jgi:hypothetical protein
MSNCAQKNAQKNIYININKMNSVIVILITLTILAVIAMMYIPEKFVLQSAIGPKGLRGAEPRTGEAWSVTPAFIDLATHSRLY